MSPHVSVFDIAHHQVDSFPLEMITLGLDMKGASELSDAIPRYPHPDDATCNPFHRTGSGFSIPLELLRLPLFASSASC